MIRQVLVLILTVLFGVDGLTADYYFDRVNVVSMSSDQVLTDQLVVVSEGRIEYVGPAQDESPLLDDLVRIDAQGLYLLPGLAEMHAHVPGRERGEQYVQDVLDLYLANGITTIRGMLGQAWHLELRRKLAQQVFRGPRLVSSGPSFNGNSVSSPAQAAKMVRAQHGAGYDFLKLHPGLGREEYLAIVETAVALEMPFAGHVSVSVGIPLTLDSGQATIDHLDGYAQELVPTTHALHGTAPQFFGLNLAAGISTERVAELARATHDAGVWNVATQSLLENLLYAQALDALLARPEMAYMRDATASRWRERVIATRRDISPELAERLLTARRDLLRALQSSGAGLLLGSDAPQIMNVPGFSIHEELAYLVNAGLTSYEALATGTVNVARFLGEADRGQVGVGHVADLVLLEANPLENIANSRRIAGVMRRGKWYDRESLDSILQQIRKRGI